LPDPRGRQILLSGVAVSSADVGLFVKKELEIRGSRNCLGDFPRVIEWLEGGHFPVDDAITRTVSLADAGEALAEWDEDPAAVTKILIDLNS